MKVPKKKYKRLSVVKYDTDGKRKKRKSRKKGESGKVERKKVSLGDADALGVQPQEEAKGDPEKEARAEPAGAEPSSTTPPPDPSVALVAMCDAAVYVSVRAVAVRSKVKWTPEVDKLAKLSPEERGMLQMFAPMAAPYFSKVVEFTPVIGAMCFGAALCIVITGHTRAVLATVQKDQAKKEDAPEKRAPASLKDTKLRRDGSKPTPEEKMKHDLNWGQAADAVPVGTVPEDVGFPPKFSPAPDAAVA